MGFETVSSYRRLQNSFLIFLAILDDFGKLDSPSAPQHATIVDRVNALSNLTKEKVRFLKPYDKQMYARELDLLLKKVTVTDEAKSVSAAQGKRFKFSRGGLHKKSAEKEKEEPIIVTETPEVLLQDTYAVDTRAGDKAAGPIVVSDADSAHNKNLLIDNAERQIITVSHTSPSIPTSYSTAKVRNISDSVVDLRDALHGPVYLENITHSVIIVRACHQLRMHDSRDTLVAVRCESRRPIIENCHGMAFAQVGDVVEDDAPADTGRWTGVDDFNWLEAGRPSTNWRAVAEAPEVRAAQMLIRRAVSADTGPAASWERTAGLAGDLDLLVKAVHLQD